MKKIIVIAFAIVVICLIYSFTTAQIIREQTKTETVFVNGMKYVVFHNGGSIQVVNVTKDLLEIAAYKRD